MNLSDIHDRVAWRIAKTEYVVVVKDGTFYNLIVDPGLKLPWHSKNKRMADQVATECDGQAMTFEDAFKFLIKHNAGGEKAFEKALVDQVKRNAQIPNKKFFRTNTNQIVDQHGNPVPDSNPN